MALYRVTISVDTTVYLRAEIEAESEAAANHKAYYYPKECDFEYNGISRGWDENVSIIDIEDG